MIIKLDKRQWLLATALLLTLIATGYFWYQEQKKGSDADLLVTATKPSLIKPTAHIAAVSKALIDPLHGRLLPEATRDIFAVQKVVPKPVPAPEQQVVGAPVEVAIVPEVILPEDIAPIPLPSAPPLTFTYIGKMGDEGSYTVFLSSNGKNFVVKAGDLLAQNYRVETVKPPLMTLTYIPTSVKQTMQIGEAN